MWPDSKVTSFNLLAQEPQRDMLKLHGTRRSSRVWPTAVLETDWLWRLWSLCTSLGCLGTLQKLNLKGCSSLVRLPESFSDLANLENLDLRGCRLLQSYPHSTERLTVLLDEDDGMWIVESSQTPSLNCRNSQDVVRGYLNILMSLRACKLFALIEFQALVLYKLLTTFEVFNCIYVSHVNMGEKRLCRVLGWMLSLWKHDQALHFFQETVSKCVLSMWLHPSSHELLWILLMNNVNWNGNQNFGCSFLFLSVTWKCKLFLIGTSAKA